MATVKNVIPGATAAARRALAAVAGATADPTLASDGHPIDGGDWLHIYVQFNAPATDCELTPWFYSQISERWYAGDALIFSSTGDTFTVIEIRGEERVYLRVDSVTGGGSINAWLGYSYDGRKPGSI